MSNETLGKKNFQSLIKQIYQQTASLISIESHHNRLSFLNSVKNFEANYVYNWQRFVFPIFNGISTSPYYKYSGFRSRPWAEYDVLDPVHGGASGWTLTAEPWATESGLPCLWDGTRGQPNSITGALYCLSARIDAIVNEKFDFTPYDDTELKGLIHCNNLNIKTLYKDLYACDVKTNCSGENNLRFSFQRHFYELFNQVISGGPDLSGDFSCEDEYPELFINLSTCDISWDPTCPLVEISGAIFDTNTGYDAVINLENNGSPYDSLNVTGQGGTKVSWDQASNSIIIDSTKPGTGEVWELTSNTNPNNNTVVDLNLSGQTSGSLTTVELVSGAGIALVDNGLNGIIINSLVYSNEVTSASNGVSFNLLQGANQVDATSIIGAGSIAVTKVSDSEIQIEGSQNIIGNIDSKSMLGQLGRSPIRAIDFYSDGACCFYEYIYNTMTPEEKDHGLGVLNASVITVGHPYSISGALHKDSNGAYEYSFDPVSTGGSGMSITFWCIKAYNDWIANNAEQLVFGTFTSSSGNYGFELFFDYPKNQPLDPEHNNINQSQGQDMNEHLCLYARTDNGYLHKLIDITEDQLHGAWHHYSLVIDLDFSSPAIDLYLDGNLYSSTYSLLLQHSNTIGLTNFDSYSLFGYEAVPCRNFNGALEDFALYSDRIDQVEITALTAARELLDVPSAGSWVNDKICEWWMLGEESQFSNYSGGQTISNVFSITSQVKGNTIGSTTRLGTEMSSHAMNYDFEFVSHIWVPSVSVVAGSPSVATGEIVLLADAITTTGWTISLIKVVEDINNMNIYHEIAVLEASNDPAYHLTQDTLSLNYYFYTDATLEDCADNIEDVIDTYIGSYYDADVPSISPSNVNLSSIGQGQRFNVPISGTGLSTCFTATGMTGGQASTGECVSPSTVHRASANITIPYNPGTTDHVGGGTSFLIISTMQEHVTYQVVSEINNPNSYSNGDLISSTPHNVVAVLNGDNLAHVDPLLQSKYRLWAFLNNFIDAINGINGHNHSLANYAFIAQGMSNAQQISINLTQSVAGVDGNTFITYSFGANSAPHTVVQFHGGTNSAAGVPANLEQYSQEAYFNLWPCTTRSIDLTPGNRFDITLTGYNTFKDYSTPPCMAEPEQTRNEYAFDVLRALTNAATGVTGSLPILPSMESIQGLDVAGVGLVLRPNSSCTEDARNVFFSTNYRKSPEYIDDSVALPDVNRVFNASDQAREWNRASKSLPLSKHGFRSFLAKWKMNLSITVGPSSDGNPNKVNLYYKGQGVEIDLYERFLDAYRDYGITPAPLGGGNLTDEEKVLTSNLLLSRKDNRNSFEVDHYNPFRHQYYSQWRMEDVYSMAVEDLSRDIEGNVIENLPVSQMQATYLVPERRYYAYGEVSSADAALPFTVGAIGFFGTIYGTNHTGNMLEFQLVQFPGISFWITPGEAAGCPRSLMMQVLWMQQQNIFVLLGNPRVWAAPPDCTIPGYDTIEAVVWGSDSGQFKNTNNTIALLQGGNLDTYYPPDGEIGITCWLEEFTVKEFKGESICDFELLNPMASSDQHWSGGAFDSNCGVCTEWQVSGPTELVFYDVNGAPISTTNGIYEEITTLGVTPSDELSYGSCTDWEWCSSDIIQDINLNNTSNSGYGYTYDVSNVESQANTTQNGPSPTWVPSAEYTTDEFYLHLISDPATMTQQIDFNTNLINVLSWTDQQNGFVLTPGTGDLDNAATEVAPTYDTANSINYVCFNHTLHQALSVTFDSKMDLDDGVDNGSSMIAVIRMPQSAFSDPIGDPTINGAIDDTEAQFLNIGRGSQMKLRRYLTGSNVWATDASFNNNTNNWFASLTGVVGTNQLFIIEFVFGQSGVANATKGIFVNGTIYSNTANPSGVTNFDFADSPKLRIGRKPDYSGVTNPSQYFDNSFGDFELVEMMAFHRELLDTEREKLEGHLAHKYSLQNALPASHPYLANPPS